ncbi:Oligopeptide transport system permease protein OppB [Pseudoclavibacter triregionum]|nr:Oligopeptide transport system permease protein OppB [Pseudoclavibacter triregionum]
MAEIAPRARRAAVLRRMALRALGALGVVWAVATVSWLAVRAVPGDPALAILGGPGSNATQAALDQARADYGLDRPPLEQYLAMLGRLAQGDLGASYAQHRPVAELLGAQLPGTAALAAAALLLAWLIALGSLAVSALGLGTRWGRAAGALASGLEIVASAIPSFWLGAVLIAIVAVGMRLPVAASDRGPLGLVLPAITLAIPLAGFLVQTMRGRVEETLEAPFVEAARLRGDGPWRIFRRHLLRHAAVPAANLSGWAFGSLVSGALIVEQVFARPGLGRTLAQAVIDRDVPLVVGVLVVSAIAYAVVTVLADAAVLALDPREREGAR